MGEQTKNLLIGIFVIASCVLIVWMVLFLKPSVGNGQETLYVRFSDVNKIGIGTRVTYAGKPVGEVIAIDSIYDARQKPIGDKEGRIFFYQVVLKVDSSVKVYDTDEVAIQTSGLLGEKSIAIIPKIPPKGVTPKLITNQPIYADAVDPIDNAFNQFSNLSTEMQKTFAEVNRWLKKNGEDVAHSVRSVGSAMDEITEVVHSMNKEGLVSEMKIAVQHFGDAMDGIRDGVAQLKQGDAFNNASAMLKNLRRASRSVEMIVSKIEQGKGTLGKIIEGDDLYLRMTSVMSKVDTLMNDINHYGILFHLNKGWQRQRAQKITTLNALDNPQNFKSYFETEVSEIHTAMSRISLLIDKAKNRPDGDEIFEDPLFRKDFAELLRQAEELSDNLRLYNQQLIERE